MNCRGLFPTLALFLSLIGSVAGGATADLCPPVAQPPTPECIQAAMRNAVDRGFLWRVVKASKVSYLFGTVHVARLDWMFPGPAVHKALLASDTVALELDMQDPAI